MKSSAFDILQAATFNAVDDSGLKQHPEQTALHALAGGLLVEAMDSDFRNGAIAAGANDVLMQTIN